MAFKTHFGHTHMIECDVAEIILDKLAKNEEKYPVETYQGRY